MALSNQLRDSRAGGQQQGVAAVKKPGGRLIELDILRGFLLLWMAFTHLPTVANIVSNQTFGFVSGAEGFIFLAGFMIGQLQYRKEQKSGESIALRDIGRRTLRIYAYHMGLILVAFTIVAWVCVRFHRLALENLLSYYLQSPKQAVIAAALLLYRPALHDILPMYVVFMILTPLARKIAQHWSWEPVIAISFAVWAAAQFGLRAWIYRHWNAFGLSVPETSTGAFDLYAWQLLWMVALALGTIHADAIAGEIKAEPVKREKGLVPWLLPASAVIASVFLVLRYSPVDQWMNPVLYGWLTDKWHLGPARVINFSALTILLVRYGTRIASLPILKPLMLLGQASIEVFSVHVLCCMFGDALSGEADPHLSWERQTVLLLVTVVAMFSTAIWARRRKARAKLRAEHTNVG